MKTKKQFFTCLGIAVILYPILYPVLAGIMTVVFYWPFHFLGIEFRSSSVFIESEAAFVVAYISKIVSFIVGVLIILYPHRQDS